MQEKDFKNFCLQKKLVMDKGAIFPETNIAEE